LKRYFIGLMSGTSLDGTDGVLVEFTDGAGLSVLSHIHRPFSSELRETLFVLNQRSDDELHRSALAANALAFNYAEVVQGLLDSAAPISAQQVHAIGCHGQTVRHRPNEFDGLGYTIQLNNAALLAELCGIDVVADFRTRDVAAGGQGAPLVPAFHRTVFGQNNTAVCVLNLGGMSNLTTIAPNGHTTGFDCGPGNVLLDHWFSSHQKGRFDPDGSWAASGCVIEPLLENMLSEPYFNLLPPKSTGRDLFHPSWLSSKLEGFAHHRPEDIQATLAELTASCCAEAIDGQSTPDAEVLVCGGGAFNLDLMARLSRKLKKPVRSTAVRGLPPDQVESIAFAWLAKACLSREAGNLSSVTGAKGPRILGAIYPAG